MSSRNRFEDGLFSMFDEFNELAFEVIEDMRKQMEKTLNEFEDQADKARDAGFEEGFLEGKNAAEDELRDKLPDPEKILTAAWVQTHRSAPSDGWKRTREEPWFSLENELHSLR